MPSSDSGTSTERVTKKSVGIPELLASARTITWRDGVCLVSADEFQNISKGTASARATQVLMQLMSIGSRLIYCLNYSLVHKLFKGRPEDRHRLLTHPIIVLPERVSTKSWIAYLREIKLIAPSIFVFDVTACEILIHHFTFGVRRHVVMLLKWSYVEARRRGADATVDEADLRRGYLSRQYSTNRDEVETLWRQSIQNKRLKDDLWCPFHEKDSNFWAIDEPLLARPEPMPGAGVVTDASKSIADFEKRINKELILASLKPEDAASDRAAEPASVLAKPANVVKLQRRKAASKDELLAGADALDDLD